MPEPAKFRQTSGETVRARRFEMLVVQTPPHLLVSLVLSIMLAAIVWDLAPRGRIYAFNGAILLSILARLGCFVSYRRKPGLLGGLGSWESAFGLSILLAGVIWGFGTWLLLPTEPAQRALVFGFVIGMTAGASYYSLTRTDLLVATLACVNLPVSLTLLFGTGLEDRVMGSAGLILLAAATRFVQQNNAFTATTHALSIDLDRARGEAEHLAAIDALSGLRNRRSFYETCDALVLRARREGRRCAVILADIDHFKRINDRFGHAAGDEAIRRFAAILKNHASDGPITGRLGGEEFAVFLAGSTMTDAATRAEALRVATSKERISWLGQEIRITASLGVAELTAAHGSLDALLSSADAAMYEAKQAGRDRVVAAGHRK